MTERELDLAAKLSIAHTHIKFLLDYARRVATRQVTQQDLERVQGARMFLTLTLTNEEVLKNG